MNAHDRLATLSAACLSPHRIAIGRDVVAAADEFLATHFGIDNPSTPEELLSKLERASLSNSAATKVLKAYEARNRDYGEFPEGSHEAVDQRFYDAIAEPPFRGWVHSLKRAFILDSAVCLSWVCKALNIDGPVLEVGCHAGYHALWLASTTGLSVTGLDLSKRAILAASAQSRKLNASARFLASDWRHWKGDHTFDLLYSVDGPFWFETYDADVAGLIKTQLVDGGVFFVVGESNALPDVLEIAARYGLSCGMSDVVGGWTGQTFEGSVALVFVKTGEIVAPHPSTFDSDAAWNQGGFASHANAPTTPLREKTQSYYRSRGNPC